MTEVFSTVSAASQLKQIASLGDQFYPSFELNAALRHLRQLGHANRCQSLLASLQLNEQDLAAPFICAHQALQALSLISQEFYQTGLGVDIAQHYQLADLGAMGTSLKHCRHLLEALQMSNAYYNLIGSFNDLINHQNEIGFSQRLVNVASLEPKLMRVLFEVTVAGNQVFAKELTGTHIHFESLHFEGRLDDDERNYYERKFGCEIIDHAEFYQWTIAGEQLAAPVIPSAINKQDAIAELQSLLEMLQAEQGLIDDIDCILKGSAGDFPDQHMISHALGISSRTLRRRLSSMGTSYSALLDKVRCQLAINMLAQNQYCNEEIAAELGYSDAANFCNAFKKWTGKAPSLYRG